MLKLERDRLAAELATLDIIIPTLPENDYLGRKSLESRRAALTEALSGLQSREERRTKIALYFGGDPVVGSYGIQAEFGTDAIGTFQDLISAVWGATEGDLAMAGPIKDKSASQLHITSLLHGSCGFLLEELDELGEPLFRTALHQAADRAAEYLAVFAGEDEQKFSEAIDEMNPRIFGTLREFFRHVHKCRAVFRMVEGDRDKEFDRFAVQRAWDRAESTQVEEEPLHLEGRLLGIIPVRRRFEFDADDYEKVIDGKVGNEFTESYIERMSTEQFAGRRWKAVLNRRVTKKPGGREVERFTLIKLDEIT